MKQLGIHCLKDGTEGSLALKTNGGNALNFILLNKLSKILWQRPTSNIQIMCGQWSSMLCLLFAIYALNNLLPNNSEILIIRRVSPQCA